MWYRSYKDYEPDKGLRKERVEVGKGIVGCEMNDLNGWGESYHRPPKQGKGFVRTLFSLLFGTKYQE